MAHLGELFWRGHWVIACCLLLVCTTLAVFEFRQAQRHDPARPRRLLLTADGRLHLVSVGGAVEAVQLLPQSLRLGRHLLLVLRGKTRIHRVFLGPDNLDAGLLAALGRRLAGQGPGAVSGVDSGASDRGRSERK